MRKVLTGILGLLLLMGMMGSPSWASFSDTLSNLPVDSDEAVLDIQTFMGVILMFTSERINVYDPSSDQWFSINYSDLTDDVDALLDDLKNICIVDGNSTLGLFAMMTMHVDEGDGNRTTMKRFLFDPEKGKWVYKDECACAGEPPEDLNFLKLDEKTMLMYEVCGDNNELKFMVMNQERVQSMQELQQAYDELQKAQGYSLKGLFGIEADKPLKSLDVYVGNDGCLEVKTTDVDNHYDSYKYDSAEQKMEKGEETDLPYNPHPSGDNNGGGGDDHDHHDGGGGGMSGGGK